MTMIDTARAVLNKNARLWAWVAIAAFGSSVMLAGASAQTPSPTYSITSDASGKLNVTEGDNFTVTYTFRAVRVPSNIWPSAVILITTDGIDLNEWGYQRGWAVGSYKKKIDPANWDSITDDVGGTKRYQGTLSLFGTTFDDSCKGVPTGDAGSIKVQPWLIDANANSDLRKATAVFHRQGGRRYDLAAALQLGPVDRFDQDECGCECDEGTEVRGGLFAAQGDRALQLPDLGSFNTGFQFLDRYVANFIPFFDTPQMGETQIFSIKVLQINAKDTAWQLNLIKLSIPFTCFPFWVRYIVS